jgi:hypothetical protein
MTELAVILACSVELSRHMTLGERPSAALAVCAVALCETGVSRRVHGGPRAAPRLAQLPQGRWLEVARG